MKRLWAIFSSLWLTIVLAVLVCAVAAWGSLVAVGNPAYYRGLDQTVLIDGLLRGPDVPLRATVWIYCLIFLIFLFGVNTLVCTVDRVMAIVRRRSPWQSFFPHIVHVGFLVALLGHLAGSVSGFRSYGNVLMEGVSIPVPNMPGLLMRLDGFDMKPTKDGDIEFIKTRIALLRSERGSESVLKTGVIELNHPLVYEGAAFYHMDQGRTPSGLVLDVGNEKKEVRFHGSIKLLAGQELTLGTLYPDFAVDASGRAYTRSNEFKNPHIEVVFKGNGVEKAFLDVAGPGGVARLGNVTVKLVDVAMSTYVVLTINKDPGIWLIIAGSSMLTLGMLLLLFFRGKRGELVRE